MRKLTDAIIAAEPSHPGIKLAGHANSNAFVIVSIPDHITSAAICSNRKPGEDLDLNPSAEVTYKGNYYATGFKLAKQVVDSAVLWTVWSKIEGQWKIISHAVLTP